MCSKVVKKLFCESSICELCHFHVDLIAKPHSKWRSNWGIPPEYCSLISVWSRVIICDFTYGDMVGCQGPLHGSVGSTMTRESLNRGIHIEINVCWCNCEHSIRLSLAAVWLVGMVK